jgi:Domain of unknown function (DUF4160)
MAYSAGQIETVKLVGRLEASPEPITCIAGALKGWRCQVFWHLALRKPSTFVFVSIRNATITLIDVITIAIYYNDHDPPHFHAMLAEHEILVEIVRLATFAVSAPAADRTCLAAGRG